MATKQKVSEREFIDAGGNVVDDMASAAGAKYSIVRPNAGDPKKFDVLHTFDLLCGEPGKDVTMFAIMGFHTKIGNVVNSVINNDKAPGSLDDAATAVAEFLNGTKEGHWREPGTGIGVSRYDAEKMLAALVEATGKDASYFQPKLQWRVNGKGEQQQPGTDGKYPKGTLTYLAFAHAKPAVAAVYQRLVAESKPATEATLDNL